MIILLKFPYKVDDNAFRASFGLNYKKCSFSSQKTPLHLKTILYVVKFKVNNLENLQQRSQDLSDLLDFRAGGYLAVDICF